MFTLDFLRKKLSGFLDLLPLVGVVLDAIVLKESRGDPDGVAGCSASREAWEGAG
jgi:hypothetical protein